MRKLFMTMLLFCSITTLTLAQFGSTGLKLGLQGNVLLPRNDFDEKGELKLSYLFRGFIRADLVKGLQLELGGGYGRYAGLADLLNDGSKDYYSTNITPIDLRLLISPWNKESYNPYLYAGIGALKFDKQKNEFQSKIPSSYEKFEEGWTAVIPAGLGIQFKLCDNFALDLSAGANFTFTDFLDYIKNDDNDFYYNAGLGILYLGSNIYADDDKDGLTNKEEKSFGSNPEIADTDGDGLLDGEEVNTYKTNLLEPDTDKDALKDGEEALTYKTDPNKADSDGDMLKDNEEVLTYKTDPLKSDTDGDGLNDGDEIIKYKTDPLNADSDKDGLKDGDEITKYKTDPLKADTDGDGLNDGDEVVKYKTDPLNTDSDKDGLKDGDEVTKYKTDPLNPDTDMGSVNDGVEVNRGTNPLNKEDDVVKQLQTGTWNLKGITFQAGKDKILPKSEPILNEALAVLKENTWLKVEIQGYTSSEGKNNDKLSQDRANAVKNWFVKNGIYETRLTAIGYGSQNLIYKTDKKGKQTEDKVASRRIELKQVKD